MLYIWRRIFRADLVIEAIVENMEVKQQLFDKVNKAAKKECIFVSNTSSLSITEIGSKLAPDRRKRSFVPRHVNSRCIDRPALLVIGSAGCISLIVSTQYSGSGLHPG
jgi:hypothetical protein